MKKSLLINGVHYYVETVGTGRPLLLLHGFTGSSQNWQPLLPQLTSAFQVIMVDIVGHGRTDSPTEESRYHMASAAADLIAILDELEVNQTSLFGYSMGGRLALFTAVAYPERITRLILESASPGLRTDTERQARIKQDCELADWIEAEGIEAFVNRWEALPLWESQKSLSQEARHKLRQQRLQNNTLGLANSLRGMGTGRQPAHWEKLRGLHTPTLLIAGALDQKFVNINREMADLLPNASLEIVPEAGHTVHLERPLRFVELLLTA